MAADPAQIPFVFLMLWIRDRFEELCIAAGASNILRWAAVRSTAAVDQRRGDVSIWDLLLDDDDVMPVIAEVVDVVKAAGIEAKSFDEEDVFLIDVLEFVREIWIWIGVAHAADDELMQMAVSPTEGGLKHCVQFGQLDRLGHDNAAPYARGHTEQLNFKLPGPGLLAARGDALRHYAAIFSESNWAAKFQGRNSSMRFMGYSAMFVST